MSTFSIRRAVAGDEAGIVAAVRAVYDEYRFTWDPDDYCADLYDIPRYYGSEDRILWVAESDEGILGCGGIETFPVVPGEIGELAPTEDLPRIAGSDCGLLRLYVHPEARRKGIGSALMDLILAHGRASGCFRMEIWSDKRLLDAHRLYEKLGARRVGERICDDPDVSPEWGMLLDL
jgi:GNAT superfamily N-acetyltransferase